MVVRRQWGEQLQHSQFKQGKMPGEQLEQLQHSQFKQGKMPSTSTCPEMVVRQWYTHTGEQLVQHSQLKQGKMPSTSPEMVVRQYYTHTVRRTISAAQSVETG